jgi:hypothetical protein
MAKLDLELTQLLFVGLPLHLGIFFLGHQLLPRLNAQSFIGRIAEERTSRLVMQLRPASLITNSV